jgi:hypothetical protein
MSNKPFINACALAILQACTIATSTSAVTIAFDSASDPAYAAEPDGAWKGQGGGAEENPPGDDNGGTGFLPWLFGGGFHLDGGPYGLLNHFIDGVDFPTTAFNNLGAPAFGLGNIASVNEEGFPAGITAVAQRPFAEPLAVGDVFSAEFDSPAEYDDYSAQGFPFAIIGFRDADGTETFNIEGGSSVPFGDFNWRYDDAVVTNGDFGVAAGGDSIAPTDTSDGSSFSLEILSDTVGRFTFDGASLDIAFQAGLPSSVFFTLFQNNAEDDTMGNPSGEHAFYFDNLRIERPMAGVPGDYNGNGTVDAADYVAWRDGGPIQNEGASPGVIDDADYNFWRTRFGATSGSGSSTAVPEPATALLLIVGIVATITFRPATRPMAMNVLGN